MASPAFAASGRGLGGKRNGRGAGSRQACAPRPAACQAACHLELMGLYDSAAYSRLSQGLLQTAHGRSLLLGLNVPNKKPGEPLLQWAQVLHNALPDVEVCVHYSLKHQRGKGNPMKHFADFCREAESLGVARVLLVTGPRGPRTDAVRVLEELAKQQIPPGALQVGVAFNACLPTEKERALEQERLVCKLRTGLVREVWLNTGDDVQLLEAGINFVRDTFRSLNLAGDLQIFGSVLLPNSAQLKQFRERPWNGVHFGEEYLGSIEGMERCTRDVLKLFGSNGVQPIVESKVRTYEDVDKLEHLLGSLLGDVDGVQSEELVVFDF